MFYKKITVEKRIFSKWILDIAVKVNCQKAATVIRAKRYLATWIRGNGLETIFGIPVGMELPD
jgi:hypothetical protein